MERETGFEPATFSLARRCSTPEPLPHFCGASRSRPATILYRIAFSVSSDLTRSTPEKPFGYLPDTYPPLSWWPAQWASTNQVKMQVKDALARVWTHIPQEPVAAVGDTLLSSNLVRHCYQIGE